LEACFSPTGSWPGFGVETALVRVGGNSQLYYTLLGKFRRDFIGVADKLLSLLQNDDGREVAQRLVHTVKGVVGTIGAVALQQSAAKLEQSIKDGGAVLTTDPQLRSFLEELQLVFSSIKEIYGGHGPKHQEPLCDGSPEELVRLLAELEPFLVEGAPRECRQILEKINGSAWPSEFAVNIEPLAKLVQKYKFNESLQIVQFIREQISAVEIHND
jgi:polar amino acid transport system substrate-binding protein